MNCETIQRIAVFCLGISALPTAKKIATKLNAELHSKTERVPPEHPVRPERPVQEADVLFTDTMEHLATLFREGVSIIGVCAAGVLIRGVAGCLENKHNEPPVLAVAEDGSAVVPLLGGHHGANSLARKIATFLEITPAVTTAGDLRFGIAFDEPPEGFILANPQDMKNFSMGLLAGHTGRSGGSVEIFIERGLKLNAPKISAKFEAWLRETGTSGASRLPVAKKAKFRISLMEKPPVPDAQVFGNREHLVFHPAPDVPVAPDAPAKNIAVGVGCERGTEPDELILLVRKTLPENGIAPESVAVVVSIDLKADEAAVHALAKDLGCPARFFDAATLEEQTPNLRHPSEIVFQEVGCHGVAEGAALAAVGESGNLRVPKVKSAGMSGAGRATCAVAEATEWLNPQKIGRAQGTLFIVGSGPGSPQWRIPETEAMLRKATDWVGYGLYLDLIADLREEQKLHRFNLGEEEVRVRHSLKLAAEGKTVALVSSGDPGIYAMGTPVFELLARGAKEWQRIHVESSPGISALQAANARSGAVLGHDFCTVSLSDLLTPWETIQRRIQAAAEGDFVIAFYNPVSHRRTTQLMQARQILLEHRPPETPVILARNLGREQEQIRVISLELLESKEVDMLTVVLVGSSQTQKLQLPNGETKVYTPRGYADKNQKQKSK